MSLRTPPSAGHAGEKLHLLHHLLWDLGGTSWNFSLNFVTTCYNPTKNTCQWIKLSWIVGVYPNGQRFPGSGGSEILTLVQTCPDLSSCYSCYSCPLGPLCQGIPNLEPAQLDLSQFRFPDTRDHVDVGVVVPETCLETMDLHLAGSPMCIHRFPGPRGHAFRKSLKVSIPSTCKGHHRHQ